MVFAGRPSLDLAQPESVARIVSETRPDAIINAAGYTQVDRAEEEVEQAFAVNAGGAGTLASIAAAHHVPLIHLSTDYVFAGDSPTPYREDAPLAPLNVYGRSKAEGERQVRQGTADHLILRTSWLYSPFGHNFVKTMIRLAAANREITVVADQVGCPTSAFDLADGLIAALARWNAGERTGLGSTYHLAGSGAASWFEFAQEIFALCAAQGAPAARVRPIVTSDWPTQARRPAYSLLDSSRFGTDFEVTLPQWRDSLRRCVTLLA